MSRLSRILAVPAMAAALSLGLMQTPAQATVIGYYETKGKCEYEGNVGLLLGDWDAFVCYYSSGVWALDVQGIEAR